jgi:hypothetical protein
MSNHIHRRAHEHHFITTVSDFRLAAAAPVASIAQQVLR